MANLYKFVNIISKFDAAYNKEYFYIQQTSWYALFLVQQ